MKSFWIKLWSGLNFIHPYQFVIYLGLFCWGAYSLVRPELLVSNMMPRSIYLMWLVLHMVAPVVVLAGKFLHRGDPSGKKVLLGWELQWLGDTAVFFIAAMTAYVFAQHSLFFLSSFTVATVLMLMLVVRDGIATCYYWGLCHKIGCGDD